MIEETANLIAIGAAFVAALSALYARWQAKAAGRANEISLHGSRLSVYSGLARFRVHLTAHGASISEEEVWRFAEIAELSEFYFTPDVHSRMSSVFENSLKLLSINDEWRDAQLSNQLHATRLVAVRYELSRSMRDECQEITDEIKKHLRVGAA